MLDIQAVPAFADNYVWLLADRAAREAVVVDPGDAAPVLEALTQADLALTGILVTHHHFDHIGGLQDLRAACNVTVYGPRNPDIPGIDHRLAASDRIEILGTGFEILEVPGHTLDHIAYFHGGSQPLLFCGDTLFAGGCGRVFEGTPSMMHQSLQSLAALPAETLVYCAHEYTLSNLDFARAVEPDNPHLLARIEAARKTRSRGEPTVPSRLAEEMATNPFLRCDRPEVLATLRKQSKLQDGNPAEVFAVVRAWKDGF